MLGGSAPAGLSFLSKAARHSSGFTKSSEDETNPVASLCESCRQTAAAAALPRRRWGRTAGSQVAL